MALTINITNLINEISAHIVAISNRRILASPPSNIMCSDRMITRFAVYLTCTPEIKL